MLLRDFVFVLWICLLGDVGLCMYRLCGYVVELSGGVLILRGMREGNAFRVDKWGVV